MGKPVCPVADTIEKLDAIISGGQLKHARCRHLAEEILKLMEDVSSGRGGPEHIPTMESLALNLEKEAPDDTCRSTGAMLASILAEHHEVFKSHLDTLICPVTDCARLIPSPCQMACPAGIDVPSYVTLIGQGRDAEAIALIRKDNPFPWVCGLICTNPCEFMCVRGRIDTPISIKYLKGFAAERAMSDG
ncbi:MAG TPA: 4Fe-4S ferredoxin, partial [Desulfobacteria bacterium]|nr:4Fe-4S ferredoxin [Desulfobacteria bacterium]